MKYLLNEDGTCKVSGCEENTIKELKIPETVNIDQKKYTVTEIEDCAFINCDYLETVDIPHTVEIIGRKVFSGCKSLINLYTHNSIKAIGVNAFAYCSSLEKVSFDYKTEIISSGAFMGCTMLTTVNIPAATELIGDNAFYGCISLKTINADARNKSYSSVDGVLYNKDGSICITIMNSDLTDDRDESQKSGLIMLPELPGDVNRDGNVGLNDLMLISMYLLRDINLDEEELKYADCNGDGSTNIADLSHMKQYIMHDKVELRMNHPDPDKAQSELLELIRSKAAEGSPLDVGYEAAGYEKMYSDNYNVDFIDGGYLCSLKSKWNQSVRKDGYYNEYNIVKEISEESDKEDFENFRRIIDYIDNEVGKDNYYIYDAYNSHFHSMYSSYPCVDSEKYKYGEITSGNNYFIEIVLKEDADQCKNPDAFKEDYVVTYEIVNKSTKHFTENEPYNLEQTKSRLISEYPYQAKSYSKVMSVANKYNNEYYRTSGIYCNENANVITADTPVVTVSYTLNGMICEYKICCNEENDNADINQTFCVSFVNEEQQYADTVKSQINNLVSYFKKNGIEIVVSDDINLSDISDNMEYIMEWENGKYYLK